jgi:hypothetical protein
MVPGLDPVFLRLSLRQVETARCNMILTKMNRIDPELPDPEAAERSVAVDLRVREEPDDDEEEDEGDEGDEDEDDEGNSDGYSE